MQPIKTRWHKLLALVEKDEVYLTAPVGGKAKHWSEFDPNKEGVNSILRRFSELPKFVVDSELIELVMDEGYEKSLLDMKKAGVLRAPYSAMLIEFDYAGKRYIILLRDQQDTETRYSWEEPDHDEKNDPMQFYGVVFQLQTDSEGEYLVMSPAVIGIAIREQEGDSDPWIGINAEHSLLFKSTPKINELVGETYVKDGAVIYRAIATAMLVMHTEGVKHETVDCSRMNKKRLLSNKPPIPRHVVLSIGRVYRSSKSDVTEQYEVRRSPRPHWRRGHIKNVHYGTNSASVKKVYINPRLVAYKEDIMLNDDPKPKKTYVVTK
jgi:hypothetical protein